MTSPNSQLLLGEAYTRRQIHDRFGGGLVTYLPKKDGRVTCGCFDLALNPEAPAKVLVGDGPDIRAEARQFAVQRHYVPVFIKRSENNWVYVGDYKVAAFKSDVPTLLEENRNNGKTDITGVLYLERSPENPPLQIPSLTTAPSDASASNNSQAKEPAISSRPAYLLTWNPGRWNWRKLSTSVSATRAGEIVRCRWSTGGTRKIHLGDRAFLLVQGEEPRGIIASGYVASEVYEGPDWEDGSKTETYVEVDFEVVVSRDSVLRRKDLFDGVLGSVHWDAESSGNEIKPKPNSGVNGSVLPEFERRWLEHLFSIKYPIHPSDIEQPQVSGIEGKRKQRLHWYKERDPRIVRLKKQQALDRNEPLRCEACSFVFKHTYDPLGDSFIECHHTRPIASLDEDHQTKLEDLALLCSNCHRMIHSTSELLDVMQLRAIVEANRAALAVAVQANN